VENHLPENEQDTTICPKLNLADAIRLFKLGVFFRMATTTKSKTMTKKKLIQTISQDKQMHPNDVRQVVQSFLDQMTESLAEGNRLEFRDFGVFEVVRRRQKIGRNPKNAAVPIVIPARYAVKFTPGKKMRKLIET
jgi:nucleoid DNA-binding protein